MKISIISAVKDCAPVLSRTLASVLNQDYTDIEHIVVDGASSDNTLEVINAHQSKHRSVISEPDAGVYDAFNKGLRACHGDAIGYLNGGDTYWSPAIISAVVDEFKTSNVDAVFGDVVIVDPRNIQIPLRRYRSSFFKPSRIAYGFMPAHPALFIRRDIYDTYGGYDPSYRIAGDFEFVARVFSRGTTSFSYLRKIFVRMPRGGLSTSGPRATWAITREMKRACTQNDIPTNFLKLAARLTVKWTELKLIRG